jgi:hypothetical protein
MAPRKQTARSRKPPAAKKPARRQAKTQALAMAEAVKREAPRRATLDGPWAMLDALLAWSPARLIAHQQAAFWEGFAGASMASTAVRKPRKKRAAKRR